MNARAPRLEDGAVARVLLVEDDAALRGALADTLRDAGFEASAHGDAPSALAEIEQDGVDLVLTDLRLGEMDGDEMLRTLRRARPQLPVVVMSGEGDIERAIAAMRAGAADYVAKPFDADDLLQRLQRCLPERGTGACALMVAADPASLRLQRLAERVAASDATVMITGASGTGKERLARFVHAHSPRAEGPFVAINCAAIPEQMLEAELFGHEKGAFTGAHRAHAGRFEQAQGGTLLLDEITEMDLALQAKILRVLQEREVQRIGSRETLALDVRVLATSNRDLRVAVAEGRFREDLYYRLNVFPLQLPALAERRGDVLPLARRLLARHAKPNAPVPMISDAAAAQLLAHDWPGNVRELENLVQRALVLCVGDVLEPEDLMLGDGLAGLPDGVPDGVPAPLAADAAPLRRARELTDGAGLDAELRQRESDAIRQALERSGGSRKDAAQALGLPARTLRYKIARLRDAGLDPTSPAPSAPTQGACR